MSKERAQENQEGVRVFEGQRNGGFEKKKKLTSMVCIGS